MTQRAPESPTPSELAQQFPLDANARENIECARMTVGDMLNNPSDGIVAIAGPCAMTADEAIIRQEGEALTTLTEETSGLVAVHRMPPWKPRSNPKDWHGLETNDPRTAYKTIATEAALSSGVAMEFGQLEHISRYGDFPALGWIGSRNHEDSDLMEQVALEIPDMPLGIKNGMDGQIAATLEKIERLRQLRGENAAPVVLLFRGGSDMRTPEEWERVYRDALQATNGKMIVDVAHGSEMAHDPARGFGKSVEGQRLALQHVIKIAEQGEIPAAVMIETSDAPTPTDPLLPFGVALKGLKALRRIRNNANSTLVRI